MRRLRSGGAARVVRSSRRTAIRVAGSIRTQSPTAKSDRVALGGQAKPDLPGSGFRHQPRAMDTRNAHRNQPCIVGSQLVRKEGRPAKTGQRRRGQLGWLCHPPCMVAAPRRCKRFLTPSSDHGATRNRRAPPGPSNRCRYPDPHRPTSVESRAATRNTTWDLWLFGPCMLTSAFEPRSAECGLQAEGAVNASRPHPALAARSCPRQARIRRR